MKNRKVKDPKNHAQKPPSPYSAPSYNYLDEQNLNPSPNLPSRMQIDKDFYLKLVGIDNFKKLLLNHTKPCLFNLEYMRKIDFDLEVKKSKNIKSIKSVKSKTPLKNAYVLLDSKKEQLSVGKRTALKPLTDFLESKYKHQSPLSCVSLFNVEIRVDASNNAEASCLMEGNLTVFVLKEKNKMSYYLDIGVECTKGEFDRFLEKIAPLYDLKPFFETLEVQFEKENLVSQLNLNNDAQLEALKVSKPFKV